MIVSDDDVAGREQNKMVGRRGLAGTAFIHKILGSASATSPDVDLKSLSDLGHAINKNLVTLGASLDRTSVPGNWKKKLNSQEMMKWNWDWVFIMNLVLKLNQFLISMN